MEPINVRLTVIANQRNNRLVLRRQRVHRRQHPANLRLQSQAVFSRPHTSQATAD